MVTRRGFMQFCTTLLAGLRSAPPAFADQAVQPFARVRLVDRRGDPIAAGALESDVTYLFHYPYVTTPCFLLRLKAPAQPSARLVTEEGLAYHWDGGVGPQHAIVSYSAICAHKMTHPAKVVSFINYRPETVAFLDATEHTARRAGVIYCCSERSVYDATDGARVLGGPAPQPLAAIRLEYDRTDDALYAAGVYGGMLFERFFDEFGQRLALDFGTLDIRRRVEGNAPLLPLDEYCHNRILC